MGGGRVLPFGEGGRQGGTYGNGRTTGGAAPAGEVRDTLQQASRHNLDQRDAEVSHRQVINKCAQACLAASLQGPFPGQISMTTYSEGCLGGVSAAALNIYRLALHTHSPGTVIDGPGQQPACWENCIYRH